MLKKKLSLFTACGVLAVSMISSLNACTITTTPNSVVCSTAMASGCATTLTANDLTNLNSMLAKSSYGGSCKGVTASNLTGSGNRATFTLAGECDNSSCNDDGYCTGGYVNTSIVAKISVSCASGKRTLTLKLIDNSSGILKQKT